LLMTDSETTDEIATKSGIDADDRDPPTPVALVASETPMQTPTTLAETTGSASARNDTQPGTGTLLKEAGMVNEARGGTAVMMTAAAIAPTLARTDEEAAGMDINMDINNRDIYSMDIYNMDINNMDIYKVIHMDMGMGRAEISPGEAQRLLQSPRSQLQT
jgi:hypothetical protein